MDSSVAYAACDVTDVDHLEATVSTAVNDFGQLDCVINNAGILRRHDFLEITEEESRRSWTSTQRASFLGHRSLQSR